MIRNCTGAITALILISLSYLMCLPPTLSASKKSELSQQFNFSRHTLVDWPSIPHKTMRAVHPSVKRLDGWLSGLGAAVAISDLDGDGFENDICHVDPRTNTVTIQGAPGCAERYTPFTLDWKGNSDCSAVAPMGCLMGDLNEDGLTDLVVYFWGRTPLAFLQNSSPARLCPDSFKPVKLIAQDRRWFTNAACMADMDGDGHCDLVFANYFPEEADILNANGRGTQILHDSKSRSYTGGDTFFLLASPRYGGQLSYREVTGILPRNISCGWTLAAGAADLDGDQRPELYLANDLGPDRLLHNESRPGKLSFSLLEGTKRFNTPSSFVLGRDSFKGMGLDFADQNKDGIFDIYVSNITSDFGLHESQLLWLSKTDSGNFDKGKAPYVQASEKLGISRSGWSWDCRLADFDNDGSLEAVQATGFLRGKINRWPELQAIATVNSNLMHNPRNWPSFSAGDDVSGREPTAFFVLGPDGRYYDLAADVGLGQDMVSRGIAVADVDGDGDLDMAVANQWQPSYFYLNNSKAANFLELYLMRPAGGCSCARLTVTSGVPQNPKTSLAATGATAILHLPSGKKCIGQVDGGSGHSGQRGHLIHFGLGNAEPGSSYKVDLNWRDSHGRVRSTSLSLKPGIHTIQLGSNEVPAV